MPIGNDGTQRCLQLSTLLAVGILVVVGYRGGVSRLRWISRICWVGRLCWICRCRSAVAVFHIQVGNRLFARIGSEAGAYYVVGGLLAVVILIIYINRKAWIERPVIRNISQSMLKEDEDEEANV